jgi:CRISPR-associated protein (Cas_Cmr3)
VPVTLTWVAVEPLDTIMVRDGRRFDAGVNFRAMPVTPPPSTFGGALHTALGRPVDEIGGVVVDTSAGPVFPAPADVVRDETTVRRLAVEQRPDDQVWDLDDAGRFSHALVGDGSAVPEWIGVRGLSAWLRAERPLVPGEPVGTGADLVAVPWRSEPRLGLARQWFGEHANTATPGMLYTLSHLRPVDGVGRGVSFRRFLLPVLDSQPVQIKQDMVQLGGRGRLARVSAVEVRSMLPEAPKDFPGGRVSVYLATPGLFGADADAPKPGTPGMLPPMCDGHRQGRRSAGWRWPGRCRWPPRRIGPAVSSPVGG